MVALADRMWIIYLSRILSGILFGIFQANIKVYTAEIAHPDMRGALGAMISCMFSLGSLYTFTVAHFTPSWRTVAWSQLVGPALLGLSVTLIPESPYWLVERGQVEEARASLRRLRGARYRGLEDELAAIVQKKAGKAGGRVLAALLSRQFVQPFLRIGVLMSLTQWAGINVISSYMVTLLKEAGSSLDPSVAPIMVSGVQLVLSVLSTLVLRVSPRKPLFLLCAGVICLAQAALATHSFLTRQEGRTGRHPPPPGTWRRLPPAGCRCSPSPSSTRPAWSASRPSCSYSSPSHSRHRSGKRASPSLDPPCSVRAYSAGICGAFTGINQFGATKLFPVYLSNLGLHGTFWIYSGVMLLEIIYAAVSIPENKGESLVKTEDKMVVKAANFGTDNSAFDSDTSLRSDT
jgi:hypothetical protein